MTVTRTTPPVVSIVIPCFNARATVVETVQSALAQKDVPVEVIVVDDGSTDGSAALLEAEILADAIQIVRQRNAGVSVARNTGLDASTGRYVCFLDSDDLLEPTFASEMSALLERRGKRIGYCNYRYFADVPGRPTINIRYPVREGRVGGWIISENFIPTPGAVLVEREALSTLRFDPRRSGIADWWMWIQLLLRHELAYSPQTLVLVRVLSDSMGRRKAAMLADSLAMLNDTALLLERNPSGLSQQELARFSYRYASTLIEAGEAGPALRRWWRAAKLGLGAREHLLLFGKAALGAVGARRFVERRLWDKRTAPEADNAEG